MVLVRDCLLLYSTLPTELYSYTEEPEFALNRDYFEEDFRSHGTESEKVCMCACVWDIVSFSQLILSMYNE